MNRIAPALIAAALSGTATAQNTVLVQFEGRITAINDIAGVYDDETVSIGLPANGAFELDLDADNLGGTVDIFGDPDLVYDIGGFTALSFGVSSGSLDLVGDGAFVTVLDDQFNSSPVPPFELIKIDEFRVSSGVTLPTSLPGYDGQLDGNIGIRLRGNENVFSSADVDAAVNVDLEELDVAEVTIEFRTLVNDIGDLDPELAELLGLVDRNTITIEVLNIFAGGRRIDLACPADVNDDDEVDFGDFFAWVNAFGNNDFRADINLDGNVNGSDFFAWVNAFQNGTCFVN